nr:glycosyltransferase family 2 protein [Marseilla massiliensis]
MDVSIIIVNYNTKSVTEKCIESIISQTKVVEYEIILVDNNSNDGSVNLFANDKRIHFLPSNINLGFGRANNLGYKAAKGKYVFLLNSDTILLNDAASIFYSKMEKSPKNIACIGAFLLDKDLHPNQSYGRFLTMKRVLSMLITSYLKKYRAKSSDKNHWGKYEDWMEVEMVIGADMFIKRDVIENLGLFDESFFMYHEENDMQRRFHKHGYKMALVKGPQIIHLEQVSSSKCTLMDKKIMSETGLFNYMRIWLTKSQFYILKIIYIILKLPIFLDGRYSLKDSCKYFCFLFGLKYKR